MDTPTILIVDDEEINVKLIKGMLLKENFNLIGVYSGQEALSMLASENPDLILLDVMMPGMDGFETCRKIKEDKKTRIIPILMVTALSEKKHRIMALESGADDFLSKPVERTELIIRVKSLLRIKKYHDELHESLQEISHKNDELRKLENFRDGLMHMIVHDLNNPLFAISGNIELLLLDRLNLTETQITAAEGCLAGCNDLKEMIKQLLDINKLENEKLQLNKEPIDLVSLINDITNQLSIKAEDKQISINLVNTNGVSSIQIDNNLIKRVILNLIDNGIRHTPSGGRIDVMAESVNNNNNVRISVKDTGRGLDPAYHQKIFNKFEQVDLKNKGVSVGSAGLGLAFCKLAVEAHGGNIWVESGGDGNGSTFRFLIPN